MTDENVDVTSVGASLRFSRGGGGAFSLPKFAHVPEIRLGPFVVLIPNLFKGPFFHPHPCLLNSAQVAKPYCVIAISKGPF